MEITALIIDDEPLAQNVLKQYAEKIPDLNIIASCNEAICAHRFLEENEVDLIFLDINMPKLSGISFFKTLVNPPLVIFTTAYSEYALEGFELNAVDYLQKPFSFERFLKAFIRAKEIHNLKKRDHTKEISLVQNDFFFLKANKKTIKVNFVDILFIEGLGDYIKVHTKNGKLVTNISMKKMMDILPDKRFYRIHKSFIISLEEIDSVEGNIVTVHGNKLPIGNSYRQNFNEYISGFLAD